MPLIYKVNNKWFNIDDIKKIPDIAEEIDCSYSRLTFLPNWSNLVNLRVIKCNHNRLVSLPEWAKLINLQQISANHNKLIHLPEWSNLTQLKTIMCKSNRITFLPKWKNLSNLIHIIVEHNKLTSLPEWHNMINLQTINCARNCLTSLPEWFAGNLIMLKTINLNNNKLTSLPEWRGINNLQKILCFGNLLTSLPEWSHMTNLRVINCSYNKIKSLPEWNNLLQLQKIYFYCNKVTSVPSWSHMTNLLEIVCCNNELKSLPISWTRLPHIKAISYSGNQLDYIAPNIMRHFIEINAGRNIRGVLVYSGVYSGVYNDQQNVHDHKIQASLYDSIVYLLKDKPCITIKEMFKEISEECPQTVVTLLEDYCKDRNVHSLLKVTFEDVLLGIWSKISHESSQRHEMIKVLNSEIIESFGKCFTGRLTRLVSCLVGFDDNVTIEISPNEQMSNISQIIYKKYKDVDEFKFHLRKEFTERGYSEEDISVWSEALEP